jgi:hypothetical protein
MFAGQVFAMDDESKAFSWGDWFLGAFAAVVAGIILDVPASFAGGATHNGLFAVLIGASPGILIAASSRWVQRGGLRQGVITGAIFVMLVGGLCGGMIAGG